MDIRTSAFDFPRTGEAGPIGAQASFTFPRRVLRATVGMAGYAAAFEGDDHHLGRLTVELRSSIDAADDTRVTVDGSFALRDWSGEFDDDYSGRIDYVVLAELAPLAPPFPGDPRGDLIVVDAEITQVIQHFRSDRHLDDPNVFPDNSIRLVADKATVVRLYVDYDASSGLAPIANLSGTLDIVSGAVTQTISPLASMVPRRDAQTDRALREHTLNFVIPEDSSRGEVILRARVFDAFDTTQFSQVFERTLVFETFPALPVMAVGINYTGPDVRDDATPATLAAPGMADFVSTLAFTEKMFPIPNVNITSLVTIDYDDEVESDINDGCGKMGDLLGTVRELRGDSDDIVLGLFNTGLNTGSVGGCGGGGAAVGRVGSGGTSAHELAHAVGRQHAPCDNVTRCATPANTDDNYPHYSGYDSDSIGEFGVDTANGAVKDPAIAHDIMGYSGNRWISPYTYKALMSRIPATFGADAARGSNDHGDWIRVKQQVLFLKMTIGRDRAVRLQPSFHFAAYPQPRAELATRFTVELQDSGGRMLRHACLRAEAHGAPCASQDGRDEDGGHQDVMWPLHIYQGVPFDPAARQLVIYEGERAVYRQVIGQAPEVKLAVGEIVDNDRVYWDIRWESGGQGCGNKPAHYLVQWQDALGTWRGLAARTTARSLRVAKALLGEQQVRAIRVLASSGIATGMGSWVNTPVPSPGIQAAQ